MIFNLELDAQPTDCKSRKKNIIRHTRRPLPAKSHTSFLRKLLKLYVLQKMEQKQKQEGSETETGDLRK